MNHVGHGEERISYLTEQEILNPFLMLEIFDNKTSDDDVQEICWTLFSAAMRPTHWRKFESPLYLYECFEQIVRLIEASYLIMQIRPQYIEKGKLGSDGQNPIACVDDQLMQTLIEPQQEALKLLTKVNSKNGFYYIKFDLYEVLFEGLEPDCTDYHSSLHEFIYDTYQDIRKIIRSLFVLFTSDTENFISDQDLCILEEYSEYGLDRDSSMFRYSDTIYDILERKNAAELINVADRARQIIKGSNDGKTHQNPGNYLYYFHEFLFIIESFYEYVRHTPGITEFTKMQWHIPEVQIRTIHHLSRKQMKRPLKYIMQQFSEKPLSKWRSILERWKKAVLSNESASEILGEVRETHAFVVRLIEIASLLEYQPDFN